MYPQALSKIPPKSDVIKVSLLRLGKSSPRATEDIMQLLSHMLSHTHFILFENEVIKKASRTLQMKIKCYYVV